MGNDLVESAGPKTYGGLQPSGSFGADEFAAHDHLKSWQDSGAGEALVNQVADNLLSLIPAYGAEQAKQAVLEYMTHAYADITAIKGELCLAVDSSNDAATFGVFWKLTDLLTKAIVEAEHAGDQLILQAIGAHLEKLNRTFRPPVAAVGRPSRTLRPGNIKPAVATSRPVGRLGAKAPV